MKNNKVSSDNKTKNSSRLKSEDDENNIEFENRCGLMRWRPDFLQNCRSIYLFLITMCIVCIVQSALSSGYMSSQITTLERRFSLDSYMLGIIQSFFDVGFISSAIFVSFFGGRGRIPLWIGTGMLIMSFGALLFTLPQFITTYDFQKQTGVQDSELCMSVNSTSPAIDCESGNRATWLVKIIFIFGQIFIGCGCSPNLSLAPTYIDDHVPPSLASALIALLYASSALGPVIGFGLGAFMLQFPVTRDTFKISKPGDTNWIGCWWGGYLLLGGLASFISIFMLMFPRRVKKVIKTKLRAFCKCSNKSKSNTKSEDVKTERDKARIDPPPAQSKLKTDVIVSLHEVSTSTSEPSVQLSQETRAEQYGKNVKDIPMAMWSLISNKIYVVVTFAICCELFLLNGFAAFLPKYIETEYKVSNIISSLIAGGLIVPAGSMGIITGGVIMHRFQLSRRKAVLSSIVAVVLVIICMILFFLSGCNNPPFAGLNTPIYYKRNEYIKINNKCVTDTCVNQCDPNQFSPLCDLTSGVTFFSACYAGCKGFDATKLDPVKNRPLLFENCTCANLNNETVREIYLTAYECPMKCNSLPAFCVLLTLALFMMGITQNPLLMVTIRSVQKHERSFALGFQFVIFRLLAYIPSPIIYGSVIDASCIHWKWLCKERGDCLVTDLKLLNYYLIGLSFAVKCGAAVFYIILYFVVPKHVHQNLEMNTSNIGNDMLDDIETSNLALRLVVINTINPVLS